MNLMKMINTKMAKEIISSSLEKKSCLGCKDLIAKSDGAGGGIYHCKNHGGLVIGEWGHWTDDSDEPGYWLERNCYK